MEPRPPRASEAAGRRAVLRRRTWIVILVALGLVVGLRTAFVLDQPLRLYGAEEYRNLRLAATVWGEEEAWGGLLLGSPGDPADPPLRTSDRSSLFDFQFQDWDGGTLVGSMLLVPIAAVGGLSMGTVKAGAILWAALALLAWVGLLGRLEGPRGAWFAAAAFACAPPAYLGVTSFHWANHAESAVFIPLLLLAVLQAKRASTDRAQAGWLAAAGALAGFSVWFSPLNLLPALLALGLAPLLLGRGCLRWAPLVLTGAALGFLPWLGRNDLADLAAFGAQGVGLGELARAGLGGEVVDPRRLGRLLEAPIYTRLAGLEAPISDASAGALELASRLGVLLAVLATALGAALALRGDEPTLGRQRFYVLAVLVGSLAGLPWVLADLSAFSHHRIAPMLPISLGLLALGASSVPGRPVVRSASAVAVGLLLCGYLVADLALVTAGEPEDEPLRPWLVSAIPTLEPRDRLTVGISGVDAGQVAPLNRGLEALLPRTTTGGSDEIRGLAEAFRLGAGGSPPPAAPRSEREARALGWGLALVCEEGRAAAQVCSALSEPLRAAACVQGSRQGSRR